MLCGPNLNDDVLTQFCGLPKLEVLMTAGQFTDAGLAAFQNAKGLRQLTLLMMGSARITDTGLAHLGHLDNLTALQLGGTDPNAKSDAWQVSDEGVKHLATLTKLEDLALRCPTITDAARASPRSQKPEKSRCH